MNLTIVRLAVAAGVTAAALVTGQLAADAGVAASATPAAPSATAVKTAYTLGVHVNGSRTVEATGQDVTGLVRPATVTFTAVNAPSTVDFRSSPNWTYYPGSTGFVTGDSMGLVCYEFGGTAGPYANTLWYEAVDYTRGGSGWISDHYLNTPGTASQPQPQSYDCQASGFNNQTVFDQGPSFTVVNAPGGDQLFDNSPNQSDYTPQDSFYVNNDTVQLYCYEFGAAVSPYNNPLWYFAYDPAYSGYGWINDHFLNTPDTAANPVPQTSHHC